MAAENHFSFLAQVNPRDLHALLAEEGPLAIGMVLASLPPATTTKTLTYFPPDKQRDLVAAIRNARSAPPVLARGVADAIREKLHGNKEIAPSPKPMPSKPVSIRPEPSRPSPVMGKNPYLSQTIGSRPTQPASPVSRPQPIGRTQKPAPKPWIPRTSDETPINAPAQPGRPASASGSPAKSPLAKLNLRDLIGAAKQAFAPLSRPVPGKPGKPEAPEGVVPPSKITINKTPRPLAVSPVQAKRPVPVQQRATTDAARRMDGMAIMAAILRAAPMDIRQNIADGDPDLFAKLKKRMFVFDDLEKTDDKGLALVFTAAHEEAATLALRFASPRLKARVLSVVSSRRAEALRAGDSGKQGKIGLSAIEAAQEKVLNVALQLQKAGRIIIDPDDPDLAL